MYIYSRINTVFHCFRIFILSIFIKEGEPVGLDIRILYRDPSLLVCEKPVGISSESPGLPDLVSAQIGETVRPVHRLDQGTGGAIILALSPEIGALMQVFLQQNMIRKEYLAVVSGCPDPENGTWTDLLWHDRNRNKTFVVKRMRKGVREAICDWTVLDSVPWNNGILTLVRVVLHTGRTHQIRIQFGSRGFPLAGDRKYGSRIASDTVALWSSGISFPHPDQRKGGVSVTSSPPSVFPWNLFPIPG